MSAKIFSYVFIFLSTISLNALTRIAGNNQSRSDNTFSFGIKQMFVTPDQRMIVAAHEPGAQNYALCVLESGATQFRPLAHEKIFHNGQKEQNNPLYDCAIAHIAPLNNFNVAIVKADDLTRVYSHNFAMFKNHLFSSKPIMDATGTYPTSGITALAAGNGYAFVAVKGHDQEQFGMGDSGIALIKFSEVETEVELDQKAIEKIKEEGKDLSDAEKEEIQKAVFQDKDGKTKKRITTFGFAQTNTVPLNNASNVLKTANANITIDEVTHMYYSPALERVYIACKVSGSGNACAIVIGYVDQDGNLQLTPVAAPELCDRDGKIVGSNTSSTIYHVKTLQTSTGYLDYLIIHTDMTYGDLGSVKRAGVYALPLLNLKQIDGKIAPDDMPLHGTLAHKHSSLTQAYGPQNPKTGRSSFLGRHFNRKPTETEHLRNCLEVDDEAPYNAIYVGGHGPHDGCRAFDDVFVQGDCVYGIANNADDASNSVYRSQAIFSADGRIKGWTAWKKVYETDKYIHSYSMDGAQGIIIAEGSDQQMVRSLGRTGWNLQLQDDLTQMIAREFPKDQGGIQGLFDFKMLYHPASLLCVTGKEKVVLATISTHASETNVRVLTENLLQGLGAICAAEVSSSYTDHLYVGGVGGLGYITQMSDGSMSCTKVGHFSFVKKLMFDECYLYVLTDTSLDRIDIAKSDFKNNQLSITRLADAQELLNTKYGFFYDCIVSGPLALLAHNNGLSRIANGHDARLDDKQTIAWTDIPLTAHSQPCIALTAVSVTGHPCDVARCGAGQIYALCGSKRERNAQVFRLAVTPGFAIADSTIIPFNDYVAKDLSPFYFNLRSYTTGFFTDGTLSFITQNKKNKIPAHITTYYGTLKNATLIQINDAAKITHMVRCSANGKWLLAGDFGLVVNE